MLRREHGSGGNHERGEPRLCGSSSAGHALPAGRACLHWFEAHDTWSGKWDAWDAVLDHGGPPEPPARPDVKKLVSERQAELLETL